MATQGLSPHFSCFLESLSSTSDGSPNWGNGGQEKSTSSTAASLATTLSGL
jgi:hypothetical protein